jgi:hypothetical protein
MFERKHWILILLGILLLFLVLAVPVGGRNAPNSPCRATQEFAGMVDAVTQHTCEICKCVEPSLALKSKSERLEVRLGPKTVFEQRDFLRITRIETCLWD